MTTINERIANLTAEFSKLSRSTQMRLRRQAMQYVRETPHMASASNYWRGLSANQVISAATKAGAIR